MATKSKTDVRTRPTAGFRVPGVSEEDAATVRDLLQQRLTALIDLELTLKHVHWNVVGPHFVAVHEMLDPQVAAVREMVDTTAERLATMGGEPMGTPGFIAKHRTWDDYSLGRDGALAHLGALDQVYSGIVADHRHGIEVTEKADPVTQDMLVGQSAKLEMFQWFVRAHLEDAGGQLSTDGADGERAAADQASSRAETI
jgi:starvation-inducible DNA-binding protein